MAKRRGFLREHRLPLVLTGAFLLFWFGQSVAGFLHNNAEQEEHGQPPSPSFESFQNWQSEFLSVAALTVLSIWPREKGRPESKPVNAPHSRPGK
ncbi:hypothetical protein LY474_32665 [Myxococcus stipitatus]|uniref:DUF6766 family protein n=1 Tax=Myxococcus stipitatus TaxID=83455 RepID=UPI001F312FD9|nr:DUF6766 family protein [Myxococcus stipitatus]MCE9672572.1 hypothetical protein [Myxococcus stipitatus]